MRQLGWNKKGGAGGRGGRVGGAVTVRGGGRYGQRAARAHRGSPVGSIAVRLPSIGSGGIGS
eukprot:jgi/Chrpa1/24733/Chrysochromulina_OHIO_Genome00028178-RA